MMLIKLSVFFYLLSFIGVISGLMIVAENRGHPKQSYYAGLVVFSGMAVAIVSSVLLGVGLY